MIKALIVLGFIIAAVLLYCVIGVVWDFGNREILAKMGRSVTLFSLTLTTVVGGYNILNLSSEEWHSKS